MSQFNNRRSWRLKFIDIDSSFVIRETPAVINGFIVQRAPKGTTRGTYFTPNNAAAIDALMGVGSADWPDLLEAKAFNTEFPIYISAPAGDSLTYHSQLGGFYITKKGIQKFYGIRDAQELEQDLGYAFSMGFNPTRETAFDKDLETQPLKIYSPFVAENDGAPFDPFSGDASYGDKIYFYNDTSEKLVITSPEGFEPSVLVYDKMESNSRGKPVILQTVEYTWGETDGNISFTGREAVLSHFDCAEPFDKNGQQSYLAVLIGTDNYFDLGLTELADDYYTSDQITQIAELLLTTKTKTDGGKQLSIPFGLIDNLRVLNDIKDETYAYFMQKSCTEKVTNIVISNIGYDKYYYQKVFPLLPDNFIDDFDAEYAPLCVKNTSAEDALADAKEKLIIRGPVALYDHTEEHTDEIIAIVNIEKDDKGVYFDDVTEKYLTSYITTQDFGIDTNAAGEQFWDENKAELPYHRFYKIVATDNILPLWTYEEIEADPDNNPMDVGPIYDKHLADGDAALLDWRFNTITLSCSEEVYTGKNMAGGQWTGSLDPTGKDNFGAEIYWPQLLRDDDVSFITVRVLQKFGDGPGDLDFNGFWSGPRIIDPNSMDDNKVSNLSEKKFTIEGDRYTSLVMQINRVLKKNGGEWLPQYADIIHEGLIEAALPDYDDVQIYMEPTGQEDFRDDLAALCKANELAAVISPRILHPDSRGYFTEQLADQLIVNGRVNTKAIAQYAGEFEVYDPITYRKYWMQPIGSVGLQIARILDLKYGGWPPAWANLVGNIGGQLTRNNVLRARYNITDEANHSLDLKGINPIVFTADEGVMITSQKTLQDPNFMSDWTYLGHALSFISVKREIRDTVMRPQIMKPITEYWMNIRQAQCEGILAKRTSGASPIWAIAKCDIKGQNNDFTKAQRDFVIKVDVKVNVFSETVTLIFENHAQDWNG